MNRHQIRKNVIQMLYTINLNKVNLDVAKSLCEEGCEEAIEITSKVLERIDEVDRIISENLENYSLNRLNIVDKSIVEYATYELISDITPKEIIISEALLLTQEFSDEGNSNQVRFNNKLIDKIAGSVR